MACSLVHSEVRCMRLHVKINTQPVFLRFNIVCGKPMVLDRYHKSRGTSSLCVQQTGLEGVRQKVKQLHIRDQGSGLVAHSAVYQQKGKKTTLITESFTATSWCDILLNNMFLLVICPVFFLCVFITKVCISVDTLLG